MWTASSIKSKKHLVTFIRVRWCWYRFYYNIWLINWSLQLWNLKLFTSWFNYIWKTLLAQLTIENFPLNRDSWGCCLWDLFISQPKLTNNQWLVFYTKFSSTPNEWTSSCQSKHKGISADCFSRPLRISRSCTPSASNLTPICLTELDSIMMQ